MAKKAIKKQKSMEETLWDSANKLRGKVESSEYKHVVLGLIFLKFASDKFEKRKQELIEEGKKEYTEMVEFYTPKSIVNLIATMIEPYKGKIYDPCCGSGGMFVQSIKFIESHHGNKKNLAIYGQEYTTTTYKLAKMNLAIRGISGNLGDVAENTFVRDQHKDLKADYIMANPPFNQKQWRADNELTDDARWNGYEVPPTGNANYGWILHMVSKLSENGAAGFLLANGALSGGGDEYKIRRKLIENGLVEAILILPQNMFYTTNISVTIWVLNKNKKVRSVEHDGVIKKYRNREKEVLFMDLRQWGEPFEKKYTQFSEDDIAKISATYHNWQSASQNDEGRIMNDECRVMNEKKHLNSELATQHSALIIHHYTEIYQNFATARILMKLRKKIFHLFQVNTSSL